MKHGLRMFFVKQRIEAKMIELYAHWWKPFERRFFGMLPSRMIVHLI